MLNSVIVQGNVVRDLEMRQTTGGTKIASGTIACQRSRTNENGERPVDFIQFSAFNKLAETMEKFVHKGSSIIIRGELRVEKYEKNGTTLTAYRVNADDFHFVSSPGAKRNGDETATAQKSEVQKPAYSTANTQHQNDDELPF